MRKSAYDKAKAALDAAKVDLDKAHDELDKSIKAYGPASLGACDARRRLSAATTRHLAAGDNYIKAFK